MDSKFQELSTIFSMCLSGNQTAINQAQVQLDALGSDGQFPLWLAHYISNLSIPANLRQSAAVHFKNLLRTRWTAGEDIPALPDQTKFQLRQSLFDLMLSNEDKAISAQVLEGLVAVGKIDFLAQWPQLLQSILLVVQQWAARPAEAVISTLTLCAKLVKKYRTEFRSDPLWLEIKEVVQTLYDPLSAMASTIVQDMATMVPPLLFQRFRMLEQLLKIFISLISQDIPEPFEQSLSIWMNFYMFILRAAHPHFPPGQDQLLIKAKTQVLCTLTMLAQKYDEDFEPFIEGFCTMVWDMLAQVSGVHTYDRFVSAALDYFRVVVVKPKVGVLLSTNLQLMFSRLILPNMIISEDEEELAEMSPFDYVKMFLEDANEETRRSACTSLVKTLVRQFPGQTAQVLVEFQQAVLGNYNAGRWKEMEAFVYLISGAYTQLYTAKHGASALVVPNDYIVGLYRTLVEPRLLDNSASVILRTTCLKYIFVYRNQYTSQELLAVLNQVTSLIEHDQVLLSTYACAVLERILMIRKPGRDNELLFDKLGIAASLRPLLQGLATALRKHPKNHFIMKAFYRVVWMAQETFAPFAVPACDIFVDYLKQVLTNPADANPAFNSLVFECMALSLRSADRQNAKEIEGKLEGYMALIIQKNNADLLPYAFQMQALFVRLSNTVSATNLALVPSILPLQNWEPGTKYYMPTLALLLEAIARSAPELLANNSADLATIIKQLFVNKLDQYGFSLLATLTEVYEMSYLAGHLKDLYITIFSKIHHARTQNIRLAGKFYKGLLLFAASFTLKHSFRALSDSMNAVQPDICTMLLKSQLLPNVNALDTRVERKLMAVALTNMLTEGGLSEELWKQIAVTVPKMLEIQVNATSGTEYLGRLIDLPEENTQQMAKDDYQKIYSAGFEPTDKLPNIANEREYFLKSLLQARLPSPLLQYLRPAMDEETFNILQAYAAGFGVQLG